MGSPRKSLAALFSLFASLWLWGCGPTNGLPPLSGEFLYASNGNDGKITQFSINTSTGALTSVNSFQTPSSGTSALLYGLTVHPTNEFLYAADPVNNALFGYDLGDGSFSGDIVYQNSDVSVTHPFLTTITPNGKFLYAPIATSIAEYSINLTPGTSSAPNTSNGALTLIGTAEVPAFAIAVDPTGSYAYAMGQSSVYELLVQPDGTLKPNGSVTLLSDLTDGGLDAITVAAPAKSTECVYVAGPPGEVFELAVQPDGTLNSLGNVSLGGSRPSDIKVHPNQHFIYTAQIIPSGAISVLTVNESVDAGPSCAATVTSTLALPESEDPSSIAIEPMGKFAYTSDEGVLFPGSVGEFSIDSDTGAATQIGTVNSESPESASTDPVWVVTTH